MLVYIFLGGLTRAIYNEVLQFFLIVLGLSAAGSSGAQGCGGWDGACNLGAVSPAAATRTPGTGRMGSAQTNPMGVEWFGLTMGLGFVLSFGYWCTDFLVVQRAMAAESMSRRAAHAAHRRRSQDVFPFLVILPGMIADRACTPAHIGRAAWRGLIPPSR